MQNTVLQALGLDKHREAKIIKSTLFIFLENHYFEKEGFRESSVEKKQQKKNLWCQANKPKIKVVLQKQRSCISPIK